MSLHSARTTARMAACILLIVAYIIYALGEAAPAPDDLKSWALSMLVFIGIGIGAAILVQILFHIATAIGIAVKEKVRDDRQIERILKSSLTEDERDRLINLKSAHLGHGCAGVGFFAALVTLATGHSAVIAMHIIYGALALGTLVEGGISISHYEGGV